MFSIFVGILCVCFLAVALICAVNTGPADPDSFDPDEEDRRLRRVGLNPDDVRDRLGR